MKSEPLVTLGIPAFNAENRIENCLRSMMAQTCTDVEILVSDNASTDKTIKIVEQLQKEDDRISLLRNYENRGSLWNINRLRLSARGKYFSFWSDDVHCDPEMICACVETLEERPDVVACYPGVKFKALSTNEDICTEINDFQLEGEDPVERCLTLASKMKQGSMMHGVFRSDAIRSACTHYRIKRPQFLLDRYFLCPIALKGKIVQIEKILMSRYLDDWQEKRKSHGLSPEDKVKQKSQGYSFEEMQSRLNDALKIPGNQYNNLQTIDSIHDLCEETRFSELSDTDAMRLNQGLFELLMSRYRRRFEKELQSATSVVENYAQKPISDPVRTQLAELAESLSKTSRYFTQKPEILAVQKKCVKLHRKVASLIDQSLPASGTVWSRLRELVHLKG